MNSIRMEMPQELKEMVEHMVEVEVVVMATLVMSQDQVPVDQGMSGLYLKQE